MDTNSKSQVVSSVQSMVSVGKISQKTADTIVDKLDDISLAGSFGIPTDDIDTEDVTLVSVLIDGSGSMQPYRDDVIKNYNDSFLKPIQGAANAKSILVSTWIFSESPGIPLVRLLHSHKPAGECPLLTRQDYAPDGGTPLYKALYQALTGIFNYGNTLLDNGHNIKRIVLLLSDGEENASRGFVSSSQLKQFSKDMLNTETCVLSYIYFGDERDGNKYASNIGFPENHRLTEDVRNQGGAQAIRRVFGTISSSVIRASQSRISSTSISSNPFFGNP